MEATVSVSRRANSAGSAMEEPPAPEDTAMIAAEEIVKKRAAVSDEQRRKDQVATEGVKQSIYLGYIHRELTSESACLELPLTLLVLICFSISSMELLGQDKVFSSEQAITESLSNEARYCFSEKFGYKTMYDVPGTSDFWAWMRLGFLPLTYRPEWEYSEEYPKALGSDGYAGTEYERPDGPAHWLLPGYTREAPLVNEYLRHGRILGGILMRQDVAEGSMDKCRLPPSIDHSVVQAWLGKPCDNSDAGELTAEKRDVQDFSQLARKQWLLTEIDSADDLHRTLIDMEDGCTYAAATNNGRLDNCLCDWCKEGPNRQMWLDDRTERVEIAYVVFNPVYGLYSYVGVNFIFNRAGGVQPVINVMSAWASVFSRPIGSVLAVVVPAALWVLTLVYVVVFETKDIFFVLKNAKEGRLKALWEDYMGVWNTIDWVSVVVGVVVLALYFDVMSKTSAVNSSLGDMMDASVKAAAVPRAITRERYLEVTELFFQRVQSMVRSDKFVRYAICVYPGIIMLRLFKSFDAQPRLAMVTLTLKRATQDLIHFSIVFVCVFLCFVIISIVFFGQDMENFSTLPRAINTCFRAMFGEADFEAMSEVGLVKAQIWYWLFMLLMVLILLNMLLAVIMDAYSDEKARSKTAQTVIEQSLDMWRRFMQYRRGERVRLNDIWTVFEKEYNGDVKAMLKDERMLKVSSLVERVPKLQYKQARRLLENALAKHETAEEVDRTEEKKLGDVRDFTERTEARVSAVLEELEYMAERVRYYDRLQANGDPEYDFHFGGEERSETQASQEAVSQTISGLSQEICGLFVENLKQIESWQDTFERQQNDLHGLVAEMQIMVRQQAWCIAAMSEAATQMGAGFQSDVG